jgi:hypothetical protein
VIKNFGLDTDKNGKEESVSLIAVRLVFDTNPRPFCPAWLCETLFLSPLCEKRDTTQEKQQN